MFQLSVELYDTKDKKVVWSDRWQENWDNLVTIKGSLSDGLLKALDTKPKIEQKVNTTNPEAYEFYLKAKHKYEKRENTDDAEIARGLLQKAIELDDNLIVAKALLGTTYSHMGDYDKAMEIDTLALKQAQALNDYKNIAYLNYSISYIYWSKGELKHSLDFNERGLKIFKKISSKFGIALCYGHFSNIYWVKGEWSKALEYCDKQINIYNKLEDIDGVIFATFIKATVYGAKHDYSKSIYYHNIVIKHYEKFNKKHSLAYSYNNIGKEYRQIGESETSYKFACKTYKICKELNLKSLIPLPLLGQGWYHFENQNYDDALDFFTQSLTIQKETKLKIHHIPLLTNTLIALCNKTLGKRYDYDSIYQLIEKTPYIPYYLHYFIYKLIEDLSYLKTAFKQVHELIDSLEDGAKFLSYPIPKAIVEEWEKVK